MYSEYKFWYPPIYLNVINFIFGLCLIGLLVILYDFMVDQTEYLLLKLMSSLVLVLVDLAIIFNMFYEYLYNILYYSYNSNKLDSNKATDNQLLEDLKKEKAQIEKQWERLKEIQNYIEKFNWFVVIFTGLFLFHFNLVLIKVILVKPFENLVLIDYINFYGIVKGKIIDLSKLKFVLFVIPGCFIFTFAYIFVGIIVGIEYLVFKLFTNGTFLYYVLNTILFSGIGLIVLKVCSKFNLIGWVLNRFNHILKINKVIEKVEESEI